MIWSRASIKRSLISSLAEKFYIFYIITVDKMYSLRYGSLVNGGELTRDIELPNEPYLWAAVFGVNYSSLKIWRGKMPESFTELDISEFVARGIQVDPAKFCRTLDSILSGDQGVEIHRRTAGEGLVPLAKTQAERVLLPQKQA